MSPCLTQAASVRLVQLAEHAFEEEQYDLGVHSLSQLASLGWHPTSNLLRQLVAVSLCSLLGTSSRSKDAAGVQVSLHKSVEASGPDAAVIIEATKLLEKIGDLTSFQVLFDNIPRMGDKMRKSHSADEDSSDGQLSEEEGKDLFSSSAISPSKRFARSIVECENVWSVFAMGDMMEGKRGMAKSQNRKSARAATLNQREGEESLLCRSEYDREAVWRFAKVLLRGWQEENQRLQSGFGGDSHLSRQFVETSNRKRKFEQSHNDRRVALKPSDNIEEAMDFVFAGLMPTSLLRCFGRKDDKSARQKLAERIDRGSTAAGILVELCQLVRLNRLDRQAMLRATASLLAKSDFLARRMICESLRKSEFEFESSEAIIMCLERTADEEGRGAGFVTESINMDYERSIEILGKDDSMSRGVDALLEAISDPAWIYSTPRDGIERAVVESQGEYNFSEIDAMLRLANVKALLNETRSKREDGKGRNSGTKGSEREPRWEEVMFAASWKSSTMRVTLERYQLKCEVVKIIQGFLGEANGNETSREALKEIARLCLTGLRSVGKSHSVEMEQACLKMRASLEELEWNNDDEEAQKDGRSLKIRLEACLALCRDMANEVRVVEMLLHMAG